LPSLRGATRRVFISAGGSGVKFGARSGRRAGLGAKARGEIRPDRPVEDFRERGFCGGGQNGVWKNELWLCVSVSRGRGVTRVGFGNKRIMALLVLCGVSRWML
jgi:hypothetical protein